MLTRSEVTKVEKVIRRKMALTKKKHIAIKPNAWGVWVSHDDPIYRTDPAVGKRCCPLGACLLHHKVPAGMRPEDSKAHSRALSEVLGVPFTVRDVAAFVGEFDKDFQDDRTKNPVRLLARKLREELGK